jgi:hypothetical protein
MSNPSSRPPLPPHSSTPFGPGALLSLSLVMAMVLLCSGYAPKLKPALADIVEMIR